MDHVRDYNQNEVKGGSTSNYQWTRGGESTKLANGSRVQECVAELKNGVAT